jgi:Uncharacterized protein conserved in bacteria
MELLGEDDKTQTITAISVQIKDKSRVNVFVDGKYELSLDIVQIGELGVKVGQAVDDEKLVELRSASEFGKAYVRAMEYALVRPRSMREMRDYLGKKTMDRRLPEGKVRKGISKEVVELVLARLTEKNYIDDKKFARFWVENRMQKKGISARRLRLELQKKGVDKETVDLVLDNSVRNDASEMQKMIDKKRAKYDDDKLVAYLVRQGFNYYDAKEAIKG